MLSSGQERKCAYLDKIVFWILNDIQLSHGAIKGRGTMLFSAFRVIYTVNELDSHAKNGQSKKKKKNIWMYDYL